MTKTSKPDLLPTLHKRIVSGSCNPSNVHLGDSVVVYHNGIYEGKVHTITYRGLGIYTTDGHKFVKWSNVILVNNCR